MPTNTTFELSFEYGSTPTPTVIADSEPNPEFENFEKQADALVRVPKKELDEKRKDADSTT